MTKLPRTLLAIIAAMVALNSTAAAQSNPYSQSYYSQPARIDNVNRYLYDKYFYHSPSVSPYANLGRPGTQFGDSYSSFVRPELERRQQAAQSQRAYIQQRKLSGKAGHSYYGGPARNPAANPTANRMPSSLTPYYGQLYQRR